MCALSQRQNCERHITDGENWLRVVPPVAPNSFGSGNQRYWQHVYPRLLEEYYRTCQEIYGGARNANIHEFVRGQATLRGIEKRCIHAGVHECGCCCISTSRSDLACGNGERGYGVNGSDGGSIEVATDGNDRRLLRASRSFQPKCDGDDASLEVTDKSFDESRVEEVHANCGDMASGDSEIETRIQAGDEIASSLGLNDTDVVNNDALLMGGNKLVKGQAGYWKQHREAKKFRKRNGVGIHSSVQKKKNTGRLGEIKEKKNWRDGNAVKKEDQVSKSIDAELKDSLQRKWLAENNLAILKAERAIAVASKLELADQVKRATTKLHLQTERNMVGIEKSHATLRATGNVPGVIGTVETVLDSTISPNSSASMQEFRRVQKENLDLLAKIERMEKRFGVDSEDLDFLEKRTYTDTSENHAKLLKYIPGDFGIIPVGEGDDGKNYFKVEVLGGDVF